MLLRWLLGLLQAPCEHLLPEVILRGGLALVPSLPCALAVWVRALTAALCQSWDTAHQSCWQDFFVCVFLIAESSKKCKGLHLLVVHSTSSDGRNPLLCLSCSQHMEVPWPLEGSLQAERGAGEAVHTWPRLKVNVSLTVQSRLQTEVVFQSLCGLATG